jgi:fused signal recognition particle receptor
MPEWWIAAGAAALAGLVVAFWAVRRRRRSLHPPTAVASGERLRRGLLATSRRLAADLDASFRRSGGRIDSTLADLQEVLIAADVGTKTASELVARVRRQMPRSVGPDRIRAALHDEVRTMLEAAPAPPMDRKPWVVLVTGVNGVGKTTTIGKLATYHAAAGRRVLLVAADTFRAAAIDQLGVWGERSGADVIRQAHGSDPSAVAFDGMKAAVARHVDVVLVDTAGRLHTQTNLMEELRKIRRVIGREVEGAPHETLLVLDATTGQNAIAQARLFTEAAGITGVVLTKLDGTARGGVAIAVARELELPLRWIGVGEGVDDLRPFDAAAFADALFAGDDGNPLTAGAVG